MKRPKLGRIVAVLLVSLMLLASARAAGEAPGRFTERLSGEEYAAAGLAKLTDAERQTLDRLIARASAGGPGPVSAAPKIESIDTASVPESARVRRSSEVPAPRTIHSRLVGRFTGWTGGTIFQLENGQRWVQVEGDSYRAHPPRENPAVEVRPAMMGTYFLKVDGYGTRCRVKLLDD